MGLDMYAFSLPADAFLAEVDFDHEPGEELHKHYWREHVYLHSWMENLYFEKGGADAEFNCSTVQLVAEDIDLLELAVRNDRLEDLASPQSGESEEDHRKSDFEFIRKAREAFSMGRSVAYYGFW